MSRQALGTVALALRLVVGALVGVAIVAGLAERARLGGPTWWLVGFAVAAVGAAWWPRGGRRASAWAAGGALVAAVVGATVLGRVPGPEPVPGSTGLTDRILGSDLPPRGVYMAVLALAVVVVLGVVLALPWRERTSRLERPAVGVGLTGGVLVGVIAVAAVHQGAGVARDVLDRRLESDAVTATTIATADRIETSGGPPVPTQVAWHHLPSGEHNEVVEGLASVPGWDAVVVKSARHDTDDPGRDSLVASGVQALSRDDGTVLWSYWRHDGEIDTVAVDPDSGRVLLLAERAAVVLDLVSGSELDERRLPVSLANARLVGTFSSDERYTGDVTLGPRAVVASTFGHDRALGVLDVASARVVATVPVTSPRCDYAVSTTTATPVIVQWAPDGACGGPHLLHLDGSRLRVTEITFTGWPRDDAEHCRLSCRGERLVATDEVVVASIWTEPLGGRGDILAMSHDGRVLWRASATAGAALDALDDGAFVVAVTDRHVVSWWGDEWHLLSLADGTEQVRAALCGNGFEAATDGELVYTACQESDRTAVLRVDNLTLVSGGEPIVGAWDVAAATGGYLITAALGDDGIVALGSAEPTAE